MVSKYRFASGLLAAALAPSGVLFAAISMVGHCDMREAKIWINAQDSKTALVECFESVSGAPAAKAQLVLSAANGFNGVAELGPLLPGKTYKYAVTDDFGKTEGTFKTPADFAGRTPPPDFEVAVLGECYTNEEPFDPPFRTPGGDYGVYSVIASGAPAAVIWAANSISLRNADYSRSGYFARYLHARKNGGMAPLLTSTANIGVMCINSYGDARADGSMLLKGVAHEAFKNFWANRTFGGAGLECAATDFKIGDAHFFILDDCSYRNTLDYKESKKSFLGEAQLDWLKRGLAASDATFKIIVMNSPVINPVEAPQNFAWAAAERAEFLDFLMINKIKGLFFVSANKPYSEITRFVRAGAYDLFEVTAGPATGRPAKQATEMNYFRVPSSAAFERSFIRLKFDGKEDGRTLTVFICAVDGKVIFKQEIQESSLQNKQ